MIPVFSNKDFVHDLEKNFSQTFSLNNDFSFPVNDFNKFLDQNNLLNSSLILVDTWANQATSTLIKILPSGSRIILLGNLSERSEGLTLNSTDLFLRYKTLEGFNLLKYLREECDKNRITEFLNFIRDDFDQNASDGGRIFR